MKNAVGMTDDASRSTWKEGGSWTPPTHPWAKWITQFPHPTEASAFTQNKSDKMHSMEQHTRITKNNTVIQLTLRSTR